MRFRKLRIAFSFTCAIACVLLIALWVRSYYFGDVVLWSATKWRGFQFTSQQGQLTARRCSLDGAGYDGGIPFADWLWSTAPAGGFGRTPTILGFELRHWWYFIAIPYWAPVAICAGLAIAPFVVRRQHLQVSLRMLL